MSAESERRGQFLQPLHLFRAIAIVLIVGAHCLPMMEWDSPLSKQLVAGFTDESSTFFMFISGFLFQHLSTRFDYRRYLAVKFRNVLLPYIILSLPAIVFFVFLSRRDGLWTGFYDMPQWEQMMMFLLTGKHLAPMWFIPLLAIYYVIAPLFVFIDRRASILYWLILPLFVLAAINGRGGPYGPLNMALYFLPVYLFGMVFSRYRERALMLTERFRVVLLAAMVALYVLYVAEVPLGFTVQTVLKPVMIPLIVWALYRWGAQFGSRLDYLATISFGIFFVHAYFLASTRLMIALASGGFTSHHALGATLRGDVPMFFVILISVLLFSTVFILIAQRAFGRHSRMLVGA